MDFSPSSPYDLVGIPMDEDYEPYVDKRDKDPTPKPPTLNSQEKTESYEGAVSGLSVEITNIVCNLQLPMHIDLHRVAYAWDNVIMMQRHLEKKLKSPACTVQVYNTGKITILGCTRVEDCKRVARGVGRSIQSICDRLGEPMRIRDYRISNIIANTKVPFNVNLPKLATEYKGEHHGECDYEQEISKTVNYKYRDINVTARVFHTGSIVLLGATSKEAIVTALKRIFPHLLAARSAQLSLRATTPPLSERFTSAPIWQSLAVRWSPVTSIERSPTKRISMPESIE